MNKGCMEFVNVIFIADNEVYKSLGTERNKNTIDRVVHVWGKLEKLCYNTTYRNIAKLFSACFRK